MSTLRIENQATLSLARVAAKFANFFTSFFSTKTKTESESDVTPKGHSFLDQATRLGCDMAHFNHIS